MKNFNNYHKKTKIKLKIFAIVLSSVVLCILLAPLFNLNLFNHKKTQFSEEFFVVYTCLETTEKTKAIEIAQKLRTRGAGGNVFWKDNFWNVAITQTKSLEKGQTIIENLSNQNINAKCYAHKLEINTKTFEPYENEIYEVFKENISVVNKLLELVEALETNEITKTDAVLEIFNLYTTHQLITLRNNILENEKTKEFYQKTLNIQSLLYMLSQNTQPENNISYQSLIRYYLFKILELC